MDFVERLFWSVAIFLGVHFIWLAWIEQTLSLSIGTPVAAALAISFFFLALRLWPYERKE